jgi:hypothetical protein
MTGGTKWRRGKGPASSRPRCTRGGSSVASIPVYQSTSLAPMVQQLLIGQGLLIFEASRSHSDTPHLIGLLRTSDKPDAGIPAWNHITFKRDRHLCLRRCLNPQFKQSSGRRHTRWTARPLKLALLHTAGFKTSWVLRYRQDQIVFKLNSKAGNSYHRSEITRVWDFTSVSDESVGLSARYGSSQMPGARTSVWLNLLLWRFVFRGYC